ncbi:hypothetical protein SDC9_146860 [bioreactor metagenome]|uniref:Aminotransferase class I/classII large domain-containing protein n=1 Tax=bioreactor metagenome TaxID=1076179 RepID=A0A645ECG0_9ZZZZ
MLREEPALLGALHQNVSHLRAGLRQLGWEVAESPSPVMCLQGSGKMNLLQVRDRLFAQGIAVEYVTSYPSAPPGGGLRLAVFATHTTVQIERLLKGLREAL